jgi:hypothetical protein
MSRFLPTFFAAMSWGWEPDFEDKLDKLHRMLVIRGMRPDRTMIVAKEYVADALGERFVNGGARIAARKDDRSTNTKLPRYLN